MFLSWLLCQDMLAVTQVCKCVTKCATVYSKLVQFILCKLFFNKVGFKKENQTKQPLYMDFCSYSTPEKYLDTLSLKKHKYIAWTCWKSLFPKYWSIYSSQFNKSWKQVVLKKSEVTYIELCIRCFQYMYIWSVVFEKFS